LVFGRAVSVIASVRGLADGPVRDAVLRYVAPHGDKADLVGVRLA
jgi:hypothetical protein